MFSTFNDQTWYLIFPPSLVLEVGAPIFISNMLYFNVVKRIIYIKIREIMKIGIYSYMPDILHLHK